MELSALRRTSRPTKPSQSRRRSKGAKHVVIRAGLQVRGGTCSMDLVHLISHHIMRRDAPVLRDAFSVSLAFP